MEACAEVTDKRGTNAQQKPGRQVFTFSKIGRCQKGDMHTWQGPEKGGNIQQK